MKNLSFLAVCNFFGSQKKTAEVLGVSVGAVNHVVLGRRPLPIHWAPIIEEASGGKFLCEEVCPKIKWSVVANRKRKQD